MHGQVETIHMKHLSFIEYLLKGNVQIQLLNEKMHLLEKIFHPCGPADASSAWNFRRTPCHILHTRELEVHACEDVSSLSRCL